jgi:ribosomal protein S18 acetylase RimI-like enzyme
MRGVLRRHSTHFLPKNKRKKLGKKSLAVSPFFPCCPQDPFDDRGFGCGVRSIQILLSWQRPTDRPPSFTDLRSILSLSANEMAGTEHATRALCYHTRILHVRAGEANDVNLVGILTGHFERGGGPVMAAPGDGGGGALVLVGFEVEDEVVRFLTVDPHGPGPYPTEEISRLLMLDQYWHNFLMPFPTAASVVVEEIGGQPQAVVAQAAQLLQEQWPKTNAEWWPRTLTELKTDRHVDLVALLFGTAVAYGRLTKKRGGQPDEIVSVVTHPKLRGRGLGQLVVLELVKRASTDTVELSTDSEALAVGLYQDKCGFERKGTSKRGNDTITHMQRRAQVSVVGLHGSN